MCQKLESVTSTCKGLAEWFRAKEKPVHLNRVQAKPADFLMLFVCIGKLTMAGILKVGGVILGCVESTPLNKVKVTKGF